jgi:hypothetical protein
MLLLLLLLLLRGDEDFSCLGLTFPPCLEQVPKDSCDLLKLRAVSPSSAPPPPTAPPAPGTNSLAPRPGSNSLLLPPRANPLAPRPGPGPGLLRPPRPSPSLMPPRPPPPQNTLVRPTLGAGGGVAVAGWGNLAANPPGAPAAKGLLVPPKGSFNVQTDEEETGEGRSPLSFPAPH